MEPLQFKPGVFYFRRALRAAPTREHAVAVGLVVIGELERTRDWLHAEGLPVPKWIVDPEEADEKRERWNLESVGERG